MPKYLSAGDANRRGLALIVGESGAGKTHFAHALAADPDYAPVLSISFDKSFDPIWPVGAYAHALASEFNGEIPEVKLDVVVLDTVVELDTILSELRTRTRRYKPTGEPFKTVVLDNLTAFQQQHLLELRGETLATAKAEWPDYMQSQSAIVALLTLLRDKCPVQFLATCGIRGERPRRKAQMEEDGLTPATDASGQPVLDKADPESTIGYRLDLSSAVALKVPGFFAVTGRLFVGPQRVRIFDTRPSVYFPIAKDATRTVEGVRPAKLSRDRKPRRMPGVLFNGTMLDIVDGLRQQNSEQDTTEQTAV